MSRLLSCVLVFVAVWGSLYCLPVGDQGNAWERSGKFQGDIVFKDGIDAKNGLINPVYSWPDRTLVYKIANHFDENQRAAIFAAFAVYEAKTCIRMREATSDDKDYVDVTGYEWGCYSYVGRVGGNQTLNLEASPVGEGCFRHGTILHEFLHALGFYHQQSATDRDDYVTIVWENVWDGHDNNNFYKYPASEITDFGVKYDYGSVMHYSNTAFSSNGEPTIVPLVAAEPLTHPSLATRMSRLLSCVLVFVAVWGSLHCLPLGDQGNAWERSGKFQGDIIFKDGIDAKNGLLNPVHYWSDRTLVYKIANHFDEDQRAAIFAAFAVYEAQTCIRMREATSDDKDYVDVIGSEGGCYSYNQTLNLQASPDGEACFRHGTILHEFLHALGFYHQQSATDRDDYVTIVWENVWEGHNNNNFDKYPASEVTDFGVRYDYGSVMHYSNTAYSLNGEPTIVPLDPNAVIGQRDGLSGSDIEKLHRMYGCSSQ